MAITGVIRVTSIEKINEELGSESLKSRPSFRKLCHFYKIFNEISPSYSFNLIPNFNRVHNTRFSYNIPAIKVRHDHIKNSFFTSALSEWNQLDLNIRNSASLNTFEKKFLNFIRPCANSIFDVHNRLDIKLLARLRLGECGKDIESTIHFFYTAPTFLFLDKPSFRKLGILMIASYLKDNQNYHFSISRLIIISTIEYLISTKRFKCSLWLKFFSDKGWV